MGADQRQAILIMLALASAIGLGALIGLWELVQWAFPEFCAHRVPSA